MIEFSCRGFIAKELRAAFSVDLLCACRICGGVLRFPECKSSDAIALGNSIVLQTKKITCKSDARIFRLE